MGYYLNKKIPEYTGFWDEDWNKDKPDWWKFYHLGYEDGYQVGMQNIDRYKNIEDECKALESLLDANFRVREKLKLENEDKKNDCY